MFFDKDSMQWILTSIGSNNKIEIWSKLKRPQIWMAHEVLQLDTFNYPNLTIRLKNEQLKLKLYMHFNEIKFVYFKDNGN